MVSVVDGTGDSFAVFAVGVASNIDSRVFIYSRNYCICSRTCSKAVD